ncbi:GCG_CRPN prefix-to-repeats domain-containing protein [Methylobacterium symbioticum]|uniref:Uncharacterized protein n=1 Tax=Methylobacterium symbioticum TaxID=2584084 RepID=A0A509E5W1_9HYPH|nr:hypothetical protein [Methylobacterium symbioticum]VUD69561.1 hypothetical protein MET9862_00112 [Methylobacterium symbioticum]
MIRKLVMSLALVSGVLLAAPAAEARDGCGPGFHRGFYGWCRPNWRPYFYRPFVYAPAYRRFGYHRWGGYRWHAGYHVHWRRFAWHGGGRRWGGYHHAGWHGGRGWGWHRRW